MLQCQISKLNVNIYRLILFISLIDISTTVHYLELRCDQIFGKKPTAIRGEIDIYLRATVLFLSKYIVEYMSFKIGVARRRFRIYDLESG